MSDLTPLSKQERAEVQARCDAATEGPWALDKNYQMYIWGPQSQMIADDGSDEEGTLTRMRGVGANLPLAANGQFIAHARTDLPRALLTIDERDKTIERLVEALRGIGPMIGWQGGEEEDEFLRCEYCRGTDQENSQEEVKHEDDCSNLDRSYLHDVWDTIPFRVFLRLPQASQHPPD